MAVNVINNIKKRIKRLEKYKLETTKINYIMTGLIGKWGIQGEQKISNDERHWFSPQRG